MSEEPPEKDETEGESGWAAPGGPPQQPPGGNQPPPPPPFGGPPQQPPGGNQPPPPPGGNQPPPPPPFGGPPQQPPGTPPPYGGPAQQGGWQQPGQPQHGGWQQPGQPQQGGWQQPGQPQQWATPYGPGRGGPSGTVHLVMGVLLSVLCCPVGGFLLGVPAIIFGSQVNSKVAAGDIAGAESSAKIARNLWIIGLVLSVLIGILLLILVGNEDNYYYWEYDQY